jgi:hypothetical protein
MKYTTSHDNNRFRWVTITISVLINIAVWWVFRRLGWSLIYINDIAPMASVLAVCAALFIWFEQRAARQRARLPRRLLVQFTHEGELVCSSPLANLSHEADARVLAQQIARHINGGRDCVFEPTRIVVDHQGETKARGEAYYLVIVRIELKNPDQVSHFRAYGGQGSIAPAPPEKPATAELKLFVCAGEGTPPESNYKVLRLPATLDRNDVQPAVDQIRDLLVGFGQADIVIKGPIVLGVALGQCLEHIPCKVQYLQLNQASKEFEVWWRNTLLT